jgi:hypothetical protein
MLPGLCWICRRFEEAHHVDTFARVDASRFDDAYPRFRMLVHLNTWMLGAFHARFVSIFSIMIENAQSSRGLEVIALPSSSYRI